MNTDEIRVVQNVVFSISYFYFNSRIAGVIPAYIFLKRKGLLRSIKFH